MAWFLEYTGVSVLMLGFVPFYSYLIGSCCFFYFIIDDIIKDLAALNTIDATETTASFGTTAKPSNTENRAKLKNKFYGIVHIYGDAIQ